MRCELTALELAPIPDPEPSSDLLVHVALLAGANDHNADDAGAAMEALE
jgi:hypothetical protein